MCGRYNLGVASASEIARLLQAEVLPEDEALYKPRYNVAPTQTGWMIRQEGDRRFLAPAWWGFPSRGGKLLINARSETARTKPTFRGAWRSRRCVIPTTGFYEWEGSAKDRRPLWFHPPDRGLLLLAGLYEEEDGGRPRFVILTTDANEVVARAHDRMPATLPFDSVGEWLAIPPEEPLEPAPPDALVATAVSKRLNSVANDDPACLEPPPPEERTKSQLELF